MFEDGSSETVVLSKTETDIAESGGEKAETSNSALTASSTSGSNAALVIEGVLNEVEFELKNNFAEEVVSESSSVAKNNFYEVVAVVDGDTIKLNMKGVVETIRLIGIDTPESVHPAKPVECMAAEASDKARELLLGKFVRFESDDTQAVRGKYGRLLGYVFLSDGSNFGEVMLEQGYANEFTYKDDYKYKEAFLIAEQVAVDEKLGLWADGVCEEREQEEVDVALKKILSLT